MTIRHLAAALFMILVFAGCKKEKNHCSKQSFKTAELQGTWTHHYSSQIEFDFTLPIRYSIRFAADSFYMTKTNYSDYATPVCYYGEWKEFVAGKYEIKNSKILFSGKYRGADFVSEPDTCYEMGNYNEVFGVEMCADTLSLRWIGSKYEGVIIQNEESWFNIKMGKE